jgi:hypothetical protein
MDSPFFQSPALGQPILPTDKRNPLFTLYRSVSGEAKSIHVYYGLELLEVVADDRLDPMFRCMIARLYNAGLKLKSLVEVFALDPKTIRSWGAALKSRDPARLQAMLFGPHAARKLTVAVEGYVIKRLPELLADKCRDFRATLQREIERFFDTRLSGETLRLLIASAKSKSAALACLADDAAFDDLSDAPDAVSSNEGCDDVNDEQAAEHTAEQPAVPAEHHLEQPAEQDRKDGVDALGNEVVSHPPSPASSEIDGAASPVPARIEASSASKATPFPAPFF